MRAQLAGAGCGAGLHHLEPGDHPGVVDVEVGADGVQPGGLQPGRGPGVQVPPGGLLQRGQQVVEGGVAERVRREVGAQPGQELLEPDVGGELLEHAGALGVGDAVEVHLDRGQVDHVGGDRVGRRQLVLDVGPGLLDVGERGPGRWCTRCADTCATTEAQVANDSLSHRSSHQRMVTRSPNHMCAISCRIVSQRRS